MNNIILFEKLRRELKAVSRDQFPQNKIIPFPAAEEKAKPGNVISFPKDKPE